MGAGALSETQPRQSRQNKRQLRPGSGRLPPPITEIPFISQMATSPSPFCQTRSENPSRLKSPLLDPAVSNTQVLPT